MVLLRRFVKRLFAHGRAMLSGASFYAVYLAEDYSKGVKSGTFDKLGGLFGGTADSPVKADNLGGLITIIVQILLVVAASVAVIFLIIGGYRYVVAHGNEEQMEAAKKTMTGAIIGIIVIVLSFTIITIIANILLQGEPGTGIK